MSVSVRAFSSAVAVAVSSAACAHRPAAMSSAASPCSSKVVVVTSQLSTAFDVYWLAPGTQPTAPLNQGRFLLGRASRGVTRFNIPTADGAGEAMLDVQHVGPINSADASASVECRPA